MTVSSPALFAGWKWDRATQRCLRSRAQCLEKLTCTLRCCQTPPTSPNKGMEWTQIRTGTTPKTPGQCSSKIDTSNFQTANDGACALREWILEVHNSAWFCLRKKIEKTYLYTALYRDHHWTLERRHELPWKPCVGVWLIWFKGFGTWSKNRIKTRTSRSSTVSQHCWDCCLICYMLLYVQMEWRSGWVFVGLWMTLICTW